MSDNKNLTFAELLAEDNQTESSENQDFYKKIGKVKILKQDKVETKTEILDKDLAKIRQAFASVNSKKETDPISSSFVPMVNPEDVLSYKKEGVQHHILRKLKNGEYKEADYIDLHGKTIEQAFAYTMEFIKHAREHEYRCILIVHGKGDRSSKEKALLKSYVAHWLRQHNEVLAYHSAPQYKGGTGALLVILKKGEKASMENFERHAKR